MTEEELQREVDGLKVLLADMAGELDGLVATIGDPERVVAATGGVEHTYADQLVGRAVEIIAEARASLAAQWASLKHVHEML